MTYQSCDGSFRPLGDLQKPSDLMFSVTKGKEDCIGPPLTPNPTPAEKSKFCCDSCDYPTGVFNGRKFGFEMTYGNWPRRKDLYSVQDCQNIADCDTLCMDSGKTTTWQNCQYCDPTGNKY